MRYFQVAIAARDGESEFAARERIFRALLTVARELDVFGMDEHWRLYDGATQYALIPAPASGSPPAASSTSPALSDQDNEPFGQAPPGRAFGVNLYVLKDRRSLTSYRGVCGDPELLLQSIEEVIDRESGQA